MKSSQTIVPYFMVLSALQFIEFAKNVFQAEVAKVVKLEGSEGVIHGEMKIKDSLIYFADTSYDGSCGPGVCGELKSDGLVPIQMYMFVDNASATYEKALAAGAISIMAVTEEDGGHIAGFVDPFSNLWWIKSLTM